MFPLKALVLCSLLFTWAGCLNMRNNAQGVNYEETSDEEAAAAYDDYSTDKEEHTIRERMTNDKISAEDIETISSKIWKSVRGLQVQYDGKPGSKGRRRRLFSQTDPPDIDDCFKKLFTFYEKETGKQDPCVKSKREECDKAQNDFLNQIFSENGPIHILHGSLKHHGIFKKDYSAFKDRLKEIWFKPYSRSKGKALDSSGFEHVFLGEINDSSVSGLHNWMRMYEEERSSNFELTSAPFKNNNIVASVNFKWYGYDSKWSSFFMYTSPATEIALYTLCFMTQPGNKCQIKLDNTLLHLQTYTMDKTAGLIGSAHPVFP